MARNKKYQVRVSYEVYNYYTIAAKNEQEAIEQALEVSATDSLNDYTPLKREGEAIVTMIGNKSVEPKNKGNEIEVLYALDIDDNTKQSVLAMHDNDWKNGCKRQAIDKGLRDFMGERLNDIFEDSDDINDYRQDYEQALDNLEVGLPADFFDYEFFFETVTII